jgi:hypothetical protein
MSFDGARGIFSLESQCQVSVKDARVNEKKSNITSKGGMLLLEAEIAGMNVYKDIKSVMQDLRRSSIERNGADDYVQGKGQLSDPDKNSFRLLEGIIISSWQNTDQH